MGIEIECLWYFTNFNDLRFFVLKFDEVKRMKFLIRILSKARSFKDRILREISCWLWLTTKPEELPGQACIFWPFNVSLQMIARQIIAWTDNGDKFLEKKWFSWMCLCECNSICQKWLRFYGPRA